MTMNKKLILAALACVCYGTANYCYNYTQAAEPNKDLAYIHSAANSYSDVPPVHIDPITMQPVADEVPNGSHIVMTDQKIVTAAPFETPLSKDAVAAGVVSPIVEYDTLSQAANAVNFKPQVPHTFPQGFDVKHILTIANQTLDLRYENASGSQITYRTAKTMADISGDYNHYNTVDTFDVNGTEVTAKGNATNAYNNVTWVNNEYSYALSFEQPVSTNVVKAMIASIN